MSDPGRQPRLVVPEGLVIDESARERLERQLASASASVAGIAGESTELAPGASYRVHAEWTALQTPRSSLAPASGPIRGAVLIRPHVEFEVTDGRVEVAGDSLLVDPGAHVHDPFRPVGVHLPASELGRPPFPRRAVVVFLGCEPLADAEWVRRLVNRLVRRDVEARIAGPDAPSGASPVLHLTRPCAASDATIRALAPDVVVTLDATAAARVDEWCGEDRSTVVVEFDESLVDPMELVSWRIGHAAGRLRARIGRRVDVPAFASLIVRLCAGPQPIPPANEPELLHIRTPVREHWKGDAPSEPATGCVVVANGLDAAEAARVAGLADNLEGAGISVAVSEVGATGERVAGDAGHARIVLLAGSDRGPAIARLVSERNEAGLPTVLDVGPADLDARGQLVPAAAALAEACGLLVAPGGARHRAALESAAALRSPGRALMLPTLLVRSRAAALRDLRAPGAPAATRVIGWRLGYSLETVAPYANAVADGIARYLTESRDHVEIVGEAALVPAVLRAHDRVSVTSDRDLDAETIAGWSAHVWTPALIGNEIVDDARVLEEASCAGVASVMPAAATGGVDGYISSHVLVQSVAEPQLWYDGLHHVLDDPEVHARRSAEASRRADAVDGAAASKAVVSRLMGWAEYEAGA
jgi:hypothetical protein